MSAHRTARRVVAACEECGRATGDRSVTTEDGYTFQGESERDDPAGRPLCPDWRPQASLAAARAIAGIGGGLRAAIEREATWRSALRDNYDDDFGQWLAYSDMYGLAGRIGFATAEEAWDANPTIQGSTDPRDFSIVRDGEPMDMQVGAALGRDPCEECGSDMDPGEPCDCARRAEARQPDLSRAVRAARETLDMGDLVIKESPPGMGGMDIYSKGPDYAEDRGDLERVTFLNERGMEELGGWIANASKVARRIALNARRTAILAPDETGKLVRRPPAKPMSVDRDVDTEGMEPETCPRCKGHGGVFPADEGGDCNLCDGHGEVFRHPDGSYSNAMDRNTYLY